MPNDPQQSTTPAQSPPPTPPRIPAWAAPAVPFALQEGGAADMQCLEALDAAGLSAVEAWARAPEALRAACRRIVFDGANPRDLVDVLQLLWFPDVEQIARETEALESGRPIGAPTLRSPHWLRPYFAPAPNDGPQRDRLLHIAPGIFLYQLPARLWLHFSADTWIANVTAWPAPASARPANAAEFSRVSPFLTAFLTEISR